MSFIKLFIGILFIYFCVLSAIYSFKLIGTPESGKSTLVKQMKIIYSHGFNKQELLSFKVQHSSVHLNDSVSLGIQYLAGYMWGFFTYEWFYFPKKILNLECFRMKVIHES